MSTRARQFADQVSNLITISTGGSNFVTPQILSASIAGIQEDINNIDLSSAIISASSAAIDELDNRIVISSASPTLGNIDGRLWVDTTTASAPILQTYGSGEFRTTRTNRIRGIGGIKTQYGPYTVHTFLSTGTFTALEDLSIEYLVVGGGGSGGRRTAANFSVGGGGAGGYRSSVVGEYSGRNSFAESTILLNPQVHTVIVGAGGAGQSVDANDGNDGNSSSFAGIISLGGGGGAGLPAPSPGRNGGSAGGSRNGNATPFPGTVNQGSAGGESTTTAGGGGGGASSDGGNASGTTSGNGGDGIYSSITGIYEIRSGGGGGAGEGINGIGGQGGGTSGVISGVSESATANTGGGSGASRGTASGSGGSGIVIIRYLT
jgi:hypothetical protein